jgi:hypothetical protein
MPQNVHGVPTPPCTSMRANRAAPAAATTSRSALLAPDSVNVPPPLTSTACSVPSKLPVPDAWRSEPLPAMLTRTPATQLPLTVTPLDRLASVELPPEAIVV